MGLPALRSWGLTRSRLVAVAGAAVVACGGAEFSSSAFDGGASDGASRDASLDAGTDAHPFCFGSTADLCSDFDDAALPERWTAETFDSGTLAENEDASTSPPNSLLAVTPALTSGATADVFVSKGALPVGVAHVDFDLRVDSISFPSGTDPTASATIAVLAEKDDEVALTLHPAVNGPYGFEVVEVHLGLGDASIVPPKVTALTTPPQPGEWTHVRVDLTPSNGGQVLQITLTDASGHHSENPVILTPSALALAEQHTFSIGLGAIGAIGAAQVRFDSVTWTH